MDKGARDERVQGKLVARHCDLVVNEAHKMSATFSGDEVKYTRRYHAAPKGAPGEPA